MKKSKFSLVFLLLILYHLFPLISSAQTLLQTQADIAYGNSLIRIFSEGKVGFIDTTGKVIIEPKFANASDFSEGLAPARINGLFGFINTTGEFVVKPKYDFAESFKNYAAVIYSDTIAGLLYNNGNEFFFPNYRSIKFFTNTNALVITHSNLRGIIDISGKLILDTGVSEIGEIKNGIIPLYKFIPPKEGEHMGSYEVAVIDTNLNFIVPFGKYTGSSVFHDKFLRVYDSPENNGTRNSYILNTNGDVIYKKAYDDKNAEDKSVWPVSDSIFVVQYHRVDSTNTSSDYCGILNTKTDSVIKNENWFWIHALSEKAFMVSERGGKRFFCDSRGKIIIDTNLYDQAECGGNDNNNYIVLRKNGLTALYNQDGKEIVPFQEKPIGIMQEDYTGKKFNKLFYYSQEYDTTVHNYRGSILDSSFITKFLFPKTIMKFVIKENRFICAYDSNFYYCLNKNWDLIFKSNLYGKKPFAMDIDYVKEMNHSTYPVKGAKTVSMSGIEEHESGVTLYISDNESVLYRKRFQGKPLYIINNLDKAVNLGSSNFLNVMLQAKDKDGKWKYIEQQSLIFCGFGATDNMLNENKFHRTSIPVFEGDFKTKLRAELKIADPKDNRKLLTIYSNEIDCKINRSQFFRKLQNFDIDLANPYNIIINR